MKLAVSFGLIILSFTLNAQVRLTSGQSENGMIYPIVVVNSESYVSNKINTDILAQIEDTKKADFCLGDYGYIYKGNFLQIHVFFNCDMQENDTHLYLNYNIKTGETFENIDIIDASKRTEFAVLLKDKMARQDVNCALSAEEILKNGKMIFVKEGFDLLCDDFQTNKIRFTWIELHSLLARD